MVSADVNSVAKPFRNSVGMLSGPVAACMHLGPSAAYSFRRLVTPMLNSRIVELGVPSKRGMKEESSVVKTPLNLFSMVAFIYSV